MGEMVWTLSCTLEYIIILLGDTMNVEVSGALQGLLRRGGDG